MLSEDYDSFEYIDLPLILRKREKEYSERWLQLSKRFSDIILVFDFDPQDHLFSTEKMERMVSFFDESTMQGKLYVNYPMVEAYRDLSSLPYDATYMDKSVDMGLLRNKRYKDMVGARSRIPQIDECNVLILNQILFQNIEKAAQMVGSGYDAKNPLRDYEALKQGSILEVEAQSLANEGVIRVLCTCLWFVIDYGPQRLGGFLRSSAV